MEPKLVNRGRQRKERSQEPPRKTGYSRAVDFGAGEWIYQNNESLKVRRDRTEEGNGNSIRLECTSSAVERKHVKRQSSSKEHQ